MKNKGGRPVKWKSVDEMQSKIDEYFLNCVENGLHQTITGLAIALNMTRQGLIDYSKKDAFADTIKKAKLRCEHYVENLALGKSPIGAIFNLKCNYGWVDKQVLEHSGGLNIKLIDKF